MHKNSKRKYPNNISNFTFQISLTASTIFQGVTDPSVKIALGFTFALYLSLVQMFFNCTQTHVIMQHNFMLKIDIKFKTVPILGP